VCCSPARFMRAIAAQLGTRLFLFLHLFLHCYVMTVVKKKTNPRMLNLLRMFGEFGYFASSNLQLSASCWRSYSDGIKKGAQVVLLLTKRSKGRYISLVGLPQNRVLSVKWERKRRVPTISFHESPQRANVQFIIVWGPNAFGKKKEKRKNKAK